MILQMKPSRSFNHLLVRRRNSYPQFAIALNLALGYSIYMNKQFAIEILEEIKGTSPSYIEEYGKSLVREAYLYLKNLNSKRKKPDPQLVYLLDNINGLLSRI